MLVLWCLKHFKKCLTLCLSTFFASLARNDLSRRQLIRRRGEGAGPRHRRGSSQTRKMISLLPEFRLTIFTVIIASIDENAIVTCMHYVVAIFGHWFHTGAVLHT